MALRFEREARLAAALSHPNIIHIFDFGDTAGGNLYLVSEFLRGETLDQQIERGAKPLEQAMALFAQMLDAVEEAHVHGVVHRDLKPENIVLVPLRGGGEVLKVLDFGIATLAEDPSPRLTAEGMLVGTPAFMAPELFDGSEATPSSDLYACALLLFEMLTGLPAIYGTNLAEVIAAQRGEQRPSLQRAAPEMGFSDCLERVMARALALSPAHRYQQIKELRAALNLCPDVVPHFHSALYPAIPMAPPVTRDTPMDEAPRSRHHSSGLLISAGSLLAPSARALMETADTPPTGREAPPDVPPAPGPTIPRDLDADISPPPAPRADAAPSSGRDGLIGRARELAALEAFLQEDRTLLEVKGAPGLGKSTLLQDLARRRRDQQEVMWITRADPTGARAPWFPMRNLALDLLSLDTDSDDLQEIAASAGVQGLPDEDARWLAQLLTPQRVSGSNRPEVRHREICTALLNLMGVARRHRPCALLMDDADQYDGATLGFVRRLADMEPTRRPALVIAGSSSTLGAATPAQQLLIGPLPPVEAQELVARRLLLEGETAPDPELPLILAESMPGSPLVLEQAVALHLQGGETAGASFAGLISRRLDLLDAPGRRVLTSLSILGSEAPLSLLLELSEAPHPHVLDALTAQDLIKLSEDGASVSCHPLIAEVVHDQTPEQEHLQLHRQAFHLLKAREAGTFTLVRHAVEGALHQKSLTLLERAAEEASAHLAHEEAVFFLRTAGDVARWDLELDLHCDEVLGLRIKLGEALLAAGQHRSAGNLFSNSPEMEPKQGLLSYRMQLGLGRSLAAANRLDRARVALRQATGQALRLGDLALIAEVYLELSQLLAAGGQWRLALEEARECLDLLSDASPGQDKYWRLRALAALCMEQLQRPDDALEMARSGLEAALLQGTWEAEASAALQVGRLLLAAGAADEGNQKLKLAMERFSSLGDRRGQAEVLLATAQGDPGQRGSLAREAAELARQVGWVQGEFLASSMSAQAPARGKHHSFD